MQIELAAAEVKVAPNSLAVVLLGAFTAAVRTAARPLPFEAHIDAFALKIKLGLGDIPRVLNAQQSSE